MNSNIDLVSGWDTLWNSITGANSAGFTKVLTALGVAFLIYAIAKYIWSRRSGRASTNDVMWTAILGALLAGPQVVIPLILGLLELIINIGVGVFNGLVN